MAVENHPGLTSLEIGQLATAYLDNQEALFEARVADLGRDLTPFGKALREEREVYAEIAREQAAAIRYGVPLFSGDVVAEIARDAGLDPDRARHDSQAQFALSVALTQHNQSCADKLAPNAKPLAARLPQETGVATARYPQKPQATQVFETGIVSCRSSLSPSVLEKAPTIIEMVPTPPLSVEFQTDSIGKGALNADEQAALFPATDASGDSSLICTIAPHHAVDETAHIVSCPIPIAAQKHTHKAVTDTAAAVPAGVVLPRHADPIDSVSKPANTGLYQQSAPADAKVVIGTTAAAIEPAALWDGRIVTLWDDFSQSMLTTGHYKRSRAPELLSTLRIVTWIMGAEFSLAYASEDELARFKKLYLLLPKDYKTLRIDYEDHGRIRTYDELIALADAKRGTGGVLALVKAKSFNKHKSTLSAAVEWAKAHRTAVRPFENRIRGLHIKVRTTSRAARLERHMTPNTFLIALFQSPIWQGRLNTYHLRRPGTLIIRDSLYWIPLMMAGNGLRREEAAQLRVRHIISRFGFWCYDLLAPDLRIKTEEASPRLVVIHAQVLAAALLEALCFGRQPDELLFPELSDDNAHGSFGEAFGKRVSNYVAHVELNIDFLDEQLLATIPAGVKDRDLALSQMKANLILEYREKFTNHGMRHWWKTYAINSQVHPNFVDDNLGHVGETRGEGGRYLKEIWVQNLAEAVNRVPMPFDGMKLKLCFEKAKSHTHGSVD